MAKASDLLAERGVTRLCHFTLAQNLPGIIESGLLDRLTLEEREAFYRGTDSDRHDGHPETLSATVQYPNAFYFNAARGRERQFDDWVVLTLTPTLVDRDGTLVARANASIGRGRSLAQGSYAALSKLYERSAPNAPLRAQTRLRSVPTSLQAEVLLPCPIQAENVSSVVFRDDAQAHQETERLKQIGLGWPSGWELVVAPELFDGRQLEATVASGRTPHEYKWVQVSPRGA